jgi:uncharacterized membrane protein
LNRRALVAALFVSVALNLFLVGLFAGGWRRLHLGPAPGVEVASLDSQDLEPPFPPPGPSGSETLPAEAAPPPSTASAVRRDERRPDPSPQGRAVASPPPPPLGDPPSPQVPGPGGRPPVASPLMRASRDLPEPQRQEFQALLRAQSEAVRPDLHAARRERVRAWDAMARGEASADATSRRLEGARLRELAARSQIEEAVTAWAARQSPEVRAQVAEALAQDAMPGGGRPPRPQGPPPRHRGGPPPRQD